MNIKNFIKYIEQDYTDIDSKKFITKRGFVICMECARKYKLNLVYDLVCNGDDPIVLIVNDYSNKHYAECFLCREN